ncbi:thiamine phosphate pyrophosphorylase [Neokomagataea thailandica NBRC 106555]|uniref:Thiamine phosphate synthase n=2 Tax=Neokomagataea TaxID=1223423 RepID=A0A4Y6V1J9_9PROT|nr:MULTISPECIES: thiamine phosphate synthase [Neokomagataea]QDH23932.1 thiamine phosphate synthase [Neokomagataea tanensis]GBR54496.1 thiamine phosphate pyrophosphorylase [Neokomagataea thailandica NBRC 106555]
MTSSTALPSRIYPIVDHPRWVERLGGAGARFIQLRLKNLSPEDLRAQAEEGLALAARHNVTLVLNDYWELALELGYPWVHLGQEDLDTADIEAIKAARVMFGLSTHSHPELERALSFQPDYIALGPIWETTLKKMAFGPQGVPKISEWRALCGSIPLVAIGGVTLERLPQCLSAGADSVSAVSNFIRHDEPEAQIKRWLSAAGEEQ